MHFGAGLLIALSFGKVKETYQCFEIYRTRVA